MDKNYWLSKWKLGHCSLCETEYISDNVSNCINENGVVIHSGFCCDETCPYL